MAALALVTGASRGIGRAVALELASSGLDVCVAFHTREDDAEQTRRTIVDRGGRAFLCGFDVADPSAYARLSEALADADLAAVVHCAGIDHRASMLQTSSDDWSRVVATNLTSFHLLCRVVVKPMIRRRGGAIVAIGSVIARGGLAGRGAYAASKAGLVAAARSLAREVGPYQIRVNVIEPGWIDTEMTRNDRFDDVKASVILRRPGEVNDVAALAGFLCSDRAAYITGAVIPVSGGLDV